MLDKRGRMCYHLVMDRLILHSDLNNFYASVECLVHPEYAAVPLAVAGDPKKRHGVVVAKNAIAKKAGVKTGDVIFEAERKCPGIVFVQPHFDLYSAYSKHVFDIYTRFTPSVEPFGPDECWLDCTGCERLFGDGEQIADKVRRAVKDETGLTVSVGVSFTKPLAKLCSDLAPPDGIFIADRDTFKDKLWQLEVGKLIFVGKSTCAKLETMGIRTIGALAACDEARIRRALGVNGVKLREAANGVFNDTVRRYDLKRKTESVGHGMTAVRDITDKAELMDMLRYLSDKIASRLLAGGWKCRAVAVDLRSGELTHKSKQHRLPRPTFSSSDIAEAAYAAATEVLGVQRFSLRTVTVSTFDLVSAAEGTQLSMFDDKPVKRENLELAIDKIRRKYGKETIRRASLIARDFIYDKSDDEDFLPFKR